MPSNIRPPPGSTLLHYPRAFDSERISSKRKKPLNTGTDAKHGSRCRS